MAFVVVLNINAQYKCFSLHKLGKYKKSRNIYLSSLFHSFGQTKGSCVLVFSFASSNVFVCLAR